MKKFKCPIPWKSLSFGPQSVPRLCCHQSIELEASDSDIFSLDHVSHIRSDMMNDRIPKNCLGCYQLETNHCDSPRLSYIRKLGEDYGNVKIEYLDLTLNNDCNLECLMCSPIYSYKLNQFYTEKLKSQQIPKWDNQLSNSDILGFKDLKMLTLTGGEPLISRKVTNLLEELIISGKSESLELRIYTNLTNVNLLILEKLSKFKKVELMAGIDGTDDIYEKIRYPFQWNKILKNIDFVISNKTMNIDFNLHCVVMTENWGNITELISFYRAHFKRDNFLPIFEEIQVPAFLHPKNLSSKEFESGMNKILEYLEILKKEHNCPVDEIMRFENFITKLANSENSNLKIENKVFMKSLISYRELK